jgi:hypothetical protein
MTDATSGIDRPARENQEIEVTPEMIEAGLDEIWNHPIMEPTESELRVAVEGVFRAMIRARAR